MSNASNPSDILGKKIFFLYPTAVVQNQIVAELTQQEFEVYIIKNHTALERMLKKYPGSVVLADIDEQMAGREWEAWIRKVLADTEMNAAVGVISANDDEEQKRKYINSVQVSCGYTVLKSDLDKSIIQIMEILKAVDAKGRRKYIRATTENEAMTTVNLPLNGTFINGTIKDISVVGISCAFEQDPELTKNALFKDIQVKLQSMLLKVEGIVFGSRMDGSAKIYVFLFTQRIDPDVRTRIRKYIQQNLQSKMDAELK
jgi:hypothetical protein